MNPVGKLEKVRLRAVLGDYPHTRALKSGLIKSELVDFDFIPFSPTNAAFKPMVRELRFDVCEMAIVTFLMARAWRKPLVLLPATMLGRFQHAYAIYNRDRATITPADLNGRRVGIRSFTTTTGAWIRGILANDHGVDLNSIRWVTFEEPHVAEYRDATERAAAGRGIIEMLMDGELDAVLGETSSSPVLQPIFGDPIAEANAWYARHRVVPINHMVVVGEQLSVSRPDIVAEVYRMLAESKARGPSPGLVDLAPFGIEASRRSLELIIDYAAQQDLIPSRYRVEELFGATPSDSTF